MFCFGFQPPLGIDSVRICVCPSQFQEERGNGTLLCPSEMVSALLCSCKYGYSTGNYHCANGAVGWVPVSTVVNISLHESNHTHVT